MSDKENKRLSKQMCRVLRHEPESVGVVVDYLGWTKVRDLCKALGVAEQDVATVVAGDQKGRFEMFRGSIRCRYGHSIAYVDTHCSTCYDEPPPVLWHCTAWRSVESIMREGILPMGRNVVHLSSDLAEAREVGRRHQGGDPACLKVDAASMHDEGMRFYHSGKNVWTIESVPPEFITIIQ